MQMALFVIHLYANQHSTVHAQKTAGIKTTYHLLFLEMNATDK